MLRQVGEWYELPLPRKLIERHAFCWPSHKRDFVLLDEVEDWLQDNDSPARLRYDGPYSDTVFIEYYLIFQTYPEAFSFLLRWA